MTRRKLIGSILGFTAIFAGIFAVQLTPVHASTGVSLLGPSTLYSGLVGWWTFDGKNMQQNVADLSGNGYNGALHGYTSTSTAIQPGKIGQSVAVNSTSQYVQMPTITQISSGDITFAGWFYFNAFPGNQWLLAQWDSTPSGPALFMQNAKIDWEVGIFSGSITSSNATLSLGRWYHLVGTLKGTTLTLYVNGVLDTQVTGYTPAYNGTAPFTISNSGTLGSIAPMQSGYVDDVRVYNRALSAQEIYDLYSTSVNKQSVSNAGPGNLASGLVGWWTFDGKNMQQNIADSSGNGNNAYFAGGSFVSTSSSVIAGMIGQALDVNGNYYAKVNNASSLNPTSAISVSLWFRQPYSTCVTTCVLLNKGDGTTLSGSQYEVVLDSSNNIRFEVSNGTAWTNATDATTIPNDHKWHHVVGTYNGSNVIIYVDDVNMASTANTAAIQTSSNPLGIASIGTSQSNPFTGSIDDVRVYNRALSAQEVNDLYSTGIQKRSVSLVGPQNLNSGLVGWWTLDGKDTNWATGKSKDKSSGGNDATFANMSTTTSPIAGKIGQAIYLNSGGTNYVQLLPNLSSVVSGDFTVSGWINLEYGRGSNYLIELSGAGLTHDFITLNSCGFGCDAFGATLNFSTTNASVQSSVNLYPGDTQTASWYLVTVTYTSSTNTLHIYQNGIDVSSGSVSGVGTLNIAGALQLNKNSFSSLGTVAYAVDDVRVYNRALSAQEILQLYNLGK